MNTEQARKFFSRDRFATLAGVEIIQAKKGYCHAAMKLSDNHLNAANVVQGGAIFTLADFAFAVASNSHGQLALAINVSISFLKGVSAGTLTAIAQEVTKPKRLGVYDCIVSDEQGDVVAKFHGMVYRKKQKLEGF